ncbi:MAG TPA: ATP-binding protein [Chloroflexia bacterium]|jgi:SpoVK/Ycf46/Vps4 family AAA+-type ATPase
MDIRTRLDDSSYRIICAAEQHSLGVLETEDLLSTLLNADALAELLPRLWDIQPLLERLSLQRVRRSVNTLTSSRTQVIHSPAVSRVFELAWLAASQLKHDTIQPVHLLIGLVQEGRSHGAQLLLEYWLKSRERTGIVPNIKLQVDLFVTLAQIQELQDQEAEAVKSYTVAYGLDPNCPAIPPRIVAIINSKQEPHERQSEVSRYDQYSIIHENEVVEEPDLTFSMVAGIDDPDSEYYKMRRLFELVFLYPAMHKELAAEYGVLSTNSVLLFGPTGVGKTYVSKAIAGEFRQRTGERLTFINAKLSSILDKWVGNTEKNISKLLQIAMDREPSLLLLDEIDSLGASRPGTNEQRYRLDWVNHLLTELDRVRASRRRVLIVGCTNSIAAVDPAIRRRFGNPIIIPMPDLRRREQIFQVHISRLSASILDPIDLPELARKSEGFTPADIEGVVHDTTGRVWLNVMDKIIAQPEEQVRQKLTTQDFIDTLDAAAPSVSIAQWVQQTVSALQEAQDQSLVMRIESAFRGYYAPLMPDGGKISFGQYSERKWRAVKSSPRR